MGNEDFYIYNDFQKIWVKKYTLIYIQENSILSRVTFISYNKSSWITVVAILCFDISGSMGEPRVVIYLIYTVQNCFKNSKLKSGYLGSITANATTQTSINFSNICVTGVRDVWFS